MARTEARIKFGIWREGLEGQGPHEKLLYVVLLTEPSMNFAGVGAIRVAKWARNASLSISEVTSALECLVSNDFILLDEDTDEVLVRTMIRNDGAADQPYVLKGAIKEALLTESPKLRRALAAELRRLPPRKPDGVSKSGNPVIYPDPHAAADVLEGRGSPSGPKGFSEDVETLLGSGLEEDDERVLHTPPHPLPSPPSVPRNRGTRIPDDFAVTSEMAEYARLKCPAVDVSRETEKFINYWLSASGAKAVKRDWKRTWQNWVLTADERLPRHLRSVPSASDSPWAAPKARYA